MSVSGELSAFEEIALSKHRWADLVDSVFYDAPHNGWCDVLVALQDMRECAKLRATSCYLGDRVKDDTVRWLRDKGFTVRCNTVTLK